MKYDILVNQILEHFNDSNNIMQNDKGEKRSVPKVVKFAEKYEEAVVTESNAVDKLQGALDVVGFEPTFGSFADAGNAVISALRAGLSKETDDRKRHLINMGISAVSLIPFADVIKVLKLRKLGGLGRGAAKQGVKGARAAREYAKTQKATGSRFKDNSEDVNNNEKLNER